MLETTTLGKTNLVVTRVGLGLAALGRPGYINLGHARDLNEDYAIEAMRERAHRVLDVAHDAGVRYYDVARSYGEGEAFLGSWLRDRRIQSGAMSIGSKWGYTYTADWKIKAAHHEIKEHSLSVLDRQWAETKENLGNHLDLYQIHSATFESGVLENTAVLSRLAQLKAEGTAIGFTVSGDRQADVIARGLEVCVDGIPLFDTVQATWNILETSASNPLQAAREKGVGVIIKEALANGRLTSRNSDPSFEPKMSVLRQQAERLECTVDAFALAAVLAQSWVDVALSGAATVEHLESNVRAANVIWDDEANTSIASLKESPEEYWGKRNQLAWN